MLIVHHGLLWGRLPAFHGPPQTQAGNAFRRRAVPLPPGICRWTSTRSAGNNARLLKMLGAGNLKPFGGLRRGNDRLQRDFRQAAHLLADIAAALAIKLDAEPLCFRFGNGKGSKTVGVATRRPLGLPGARGGFLPDEAVRAGRVAGVAEKIQRPSNITGRQASFLIIIFDYEDCRKNRLNSGLAGACARPVDFVGRRPLCLSFVPKYRT